MRVIAPVIFATASIATAACGSGCTANTVRWRGHVFHEVRTLADLPPRIQSALGATRPGIDGIADRDEPFNATDVVYNDHPTRRFLTAGSDGDTWLVAVEHGGRGYNVEVSLFSPEALPKEKWVLLAHPRTLEDVVREVSRQGQP